MARSRMRRGARSSSRGAVVRVKKDWVYNQQSYSPSASSTLAAGIAGSLAFPLTVSQNARRLYTYGRIGLAPSFGADQYQSWAAIPEGGKQRVYAVQGWLRIAPDTWAVGNEFILGWRIAMQEMDPETGQMLVVPAYSMFANSTDRTAAQIANDGKWVKQKYIAEGPLSTTVISVRGQFMLPIFWSSKRGVTLNNADAMYLYVETMTGSVQMRAIPFLRALCSGVAG